MLNQTVFYSWPTFRLNSATGLHHVQTTSHKSKRVTWRRSPQVKGNRATRTDKLLNTGIRPLDENLTSMTKCNQTE